MTLAATLLSTIRDNIKVDLEAIFLYGAVGTDTTTPTSADTTLGTEVLRSEIDEFDSSVSDAVTASLRISAAEANGNTLAETGWFDDATAGTMHVRNTFTGINKTDDIQVFLDCTISILVTEVLS